MSKTDLGTTPTSPKHPPPPPPPADISVITWQPVQGRLADDPRVTQAIRPRPKMDAWNDVRGWEESVDSMVEGVRDRVKHDRRPVICPQDWGWGRGDNPDHYPPTSRHPRRDDRRWSLTCAYRHGKKFVDPVDVVAEWTSRSETVWQMLAARLQEEKLPTPDFRFDYEDGSVALHERLMTETTYLPLVKAFGDCPPSVGNWRGGHDTYMGVYYDMSSGATVTGLMSRFRSESSGWRGVGKKLCPYIIMPGEVFGGTFAWEAKKSLVRFFWRFLYLQGVREFFCWQSSGPSTADWEDLADIIEGLDKLGRSEVLMA